ncbi:MAG: hypothetical protein O3B31_16025, partial [Chloroflexi bacterium]|nr:hypothetical protein [Chloroflexota bacterium]
AAGQGGPRGGFAAALNQAPPAPGMSASVTLLIEAKEGVLSVPASAVHQRGAERYVLVPGPDDTEQERVVTVGLTNGTSTEITSGLEDGDAILLGTIAATTSTSAAGAAPAGGPPGGGAGGFGGLR